MENPEKIPLKHFKISINELYKNTQSVPRSKHTPSLL